MFANHSNPEYIKTGKASLKLRLINQRADLSFVLFSGGLSNVSANAQYFFLLVYSYLFLAGTTSVYLIICVLIIAA